jgi:hypothetical protein
VNEDPRIVQLAQDARVNAWVDNKTDLRAVYRHIRSDANRTTSRPELTELYRRAGRLVTLNHASAWSREFKGAIGEIRYVAEDGFATTARKIYTRAEQVGITAEYDETWGNLDARRYRR